VGLALRGTSGDVGAGGGATAHPDERDGVDRAVECPVSAPVEAMSHGAAAAGGQRRDSAQRGERRVVSTLSGVGEAHDHLGGADRADAGLVGKPGNEIVHDGQQLGAVGREVAAMITQGESQSSDLGVAHRLLAGAIMWCPSPGQGRPDGVGKCAAGEVALSVLAAEQQRA
jgi:hypothetical protein